jgi:hypothetical protein
MSSALRLFLGLSLLATVAGCDNAGETSEPTGPKAVTGGSSASSGGAGVIPSAGSSSLNTSGTGTTSTAGSSTTNGGASASGGTATSAGGSAGGASLPEGVPLTSADGWVDMASNTLGVQGAMFSFADDASKMGLVEDFIGPDACIKGTAAKVDLKCTPVAPAVDCYGQFWGAAIGLNLNQAIDPVTLQGSVTPMPFDASALKGFAFEITGTAVPTSLRFKVENASGEYCNPAKKPILAGANTILFSDLMTECWKVGGMSAEGAKSSLVKIAWQVVTNSSAAIPFDYCVSNVRALQ